MKERQRDNYKRALAEACNEYIVKNNIDHTMFATTMLVSYLPDSNERDLMVTALNRKVLTAVVKDFGTENATLIITTFFDDETQTKEIKL